MRLPSRKKKTPEEPGPDDTQEMFTAGHALPDDEAEPEAPQVVEDESADEIDTEVEPDAEAEADGEFEEYEDEDWDEGESEFDADEDDDSPSEEKSEPTFIDAFTARVVELLNQGKTAWLNLLGKIGAIKLPRHELDGQKAMIAGGILIVALLVGSAGYVIGKSSGDNVDTARLEGELAGKQEGALEGSTKGYAAGFKKGRDIAFRKSYEASYKRNYIRAYEDAGMDAPKKKSIKVPKP